MLNTNDSIKTRLWEIDSFRGIAVMGMIAVHIFFVLNFFNITKIDMYSGGWLIIIRLIQFIFLGLTGVSITLSRNGYKSNLTRGLKILSLGILISAITYFFAPKEFIKFGILHLIGLSIIILSPISNKKYLNLLLGLVVLLLWKPIVGQSSTITLLYIFGIKIDNVPALDYFPIFPWISIILFGIFIGNLFRERITTKLQKKTNTPKLLMPFAILGRNSLAVYVTHIPIIITILTALNIIPISELLN